MSECCSLCEIALRELILRVIVCALMLGIIYFLIALAVLLVGAYFYSKIAERAYGANPEMIMPCHAKADGVDYVELPMWKVMMIQLLNIAGLGPIFGALAGCLFGPVALIWIVLGCVLGGAVHDMLAATMSAEHDGENLPSTVGRYLGRTGRVMTLIACVLLSFLVGLLFTLGPAGMLHALVDEISVFWWSVVIISYYFIATVLPIQSLIGRIYPYFGILFLLMTVGVFVALLTSGIELIPDREWFANRHPVEGLSIWPMIFVTIACGAVSGFHATQSPMMVRCLGSMKSVRPVFYGSMVIEGVVTMIWVVVGLSLRELFTDYALVADASGTFSVQRAAVEGGGQQLLSFAELILKSPATAVNFATTHLLGGVGAVIALIGVVVLPITSGDTALRSSRLMLAEAFHLGQAKLSRRLLIAIPLFVCVISLTQVDYASAWRYLGWVNQLLACMTLWTLSVLLKRRGRFHFITSLPAAFMTTVCVTYLLCAPECFSFDLMVSTVNALCFVAVLYGVFLSLVRPKNS